MGLLEVAVLRAENDLAMKEEEDVEFELRTEAGWEPETAGLWCVSDGETEARQAGAEQGADGKGNLARHDGADDDGLVGGSVDVGVALPSVIVLIFGLKGDVEDVAVVDAFRAKEAESIDGLIV